MLSIICVNKGGYGLLESAISFNMQLNKNVELIFVLRDVKSDLINEINTLTLDYKSVVIIENKCMNLCNAINIGLNIASESYSLFIDGGDKLINKYCTDMILNDLCDLNNNECLAYSTVIKSKNNYYLRKPHFNSDGISVGHSSFVSQINNNLQFNENFPFSADHQYINEATNIYGVRIINEPISEFMFGGISTRPSFNNLITAIYYEPFKTKIRFLYRFIGRLIPESLWVKITMKIKRYPLYDKTRNKN